VESAGWPSSHCEALKEFVTRGMSYRDAADALNARFGTAYSRDAALGRARRMGLGEPKRPDTPPILARELLQQPRERPRSANDFRPLEFFRRRPVFEPVERVRLRCVEVAPRHLTLIELGRGDCRFPYGGDSDGEAITFCGRPRRKGSSYCTPHFHLAREPVVPLERPVSAAPLRLVDAVGR
jgi:GcrA cell cycle regulator